MKTTKHISLKLILSAMALLVSGSLSAHWTTKGPYGGKVKCLTVCDTMVYVGTYDGGVYRSTNSSLAAWKYINYTGLSTGTINALSSIGKKVLAGTPSGIFRSPDQGNTWGTFNSGLSNTNVLSLINSGQYLFAGTNGGGVFMSSDSALTWTQVNTGLTNMTITAFAVNGSTVYAGTAGSGVYMTTNNGGNWTAINNGIGSMDISALVVSGNNIFAGTPFTGIQVSNIATINWAPANTGLVNVVVNNLAASGGTVFAATDGGVYLSSNVSPSWTAANTGYTMSVKSVVIYNTKMIAGTLADGLYKSNSLASVNWVQTNTGFNNLETYTVYNSDLLVIAATNKGLFVSRDLAASYRRANNGLTDSLNVRCLTFAGTKLYVGTLNGGVFMSPDTGRTWTTANTGLGSMSILKIIANNTHIIAAGSNGTVYSSLLSAINWSATTGVGGSQAVAAFATDGTTTFLGQIGSGVYVTTDNMTWSAFNAGLNNFAVTSLAIKSGNLYAGTNGGGIFKSPVSGAAWATANNGLPTMNILSLCAAGQWVVCGYKGGVYATVDDGASWLPPSILLYIPEFADVNNLSFSGSSTRIFAGLPNNSLYSNAVSELPVGIAENSKDASGLVLSPNPSNGNFHLSFTNGITLKGIQVFDMNGKQVSFTQSAGAASVQLNVMAPAGIYFVKADTDKGTLVKKIILQ